MARDDERNFPELPPRQCHRLHKMFQVELNEVTFLINHIYWRMRKESKKDKNEEVEDVKDFLILNVKDWRKVDL